MLTSYNSKPRFGFHYHFWHFVYACIPSVLFILGVKFYFKDIDINNSFPRAMSTEEITHALKQVDQLLHDRDRLERVTKGEEEFAATPDLAKVKRRLRQPHDAEDKKL